MATQLFIDRGIESVTIEMIAREAGIGKGTIYKHFSSKNELYAILVTEQNRAIIEAFHTIPLDVPIMVQLKRTIRTTWDLQTENVETFGVYRKCDQLLRIDDLSESLRKRLEEQYQARNAFIGSMIRKAIDEEIFAPGSVEEMSAVAVSLFRGIFDLKMKGEVEASESLYLLIEKMIFNGFLR